MAAAVAEFDKISKLYVSGIFRPRVVTAVQEVTLRIEPGEVFGLLGPNRAGKTTLVKILLSLCAPSGGAIHRFGRPASDRLTLSRVGYMHENHAFPRYLNATTLLRYYGALSLLPEPEVASRTTRLLEQVGLADRAREPISNFSKGMIQRLGLAQALLNDPDLLVLDEPTEGLDLNGRQLLRDVVARQRGQGKTVLLISHVTTEVEQLCDRVAVLTQGRVGYLGTMAELTRDPSTGATRSLEVSLKDLYATFAA